MDGTVTNEGRKRRLPLWMLGVAGADQVSKSENGDVSDVVIIEQERIETQGQLTKSKATRTARQRQGKEILLPVPDKEALNVDESCLLVKCEKKRTKRKATRKDASCDNNDTETGCEKRKTRGGVRHSGPPKRQKAKSSAFESGEEIEVSSSRTVRQSNARERQKEKLSGFESSEEIEVPSPNEDEGDLTMEDLMSIAKEFVKDDDDIVQRRPSSEHKVESQSATIAFSRNEQGGSFNAHESNRRPSPHKETVSSRNSAEILTCDRVVVNPPSMTGDPTTDMLNLFLGPLLKKPHDEESKAKSITQDMAFYHEYRKSTQEVGFAKPPVPLTKKKSSLKDKVAAFLD